MLIKNIFIAVLVVLLTAVGVLYFQKTEASTGNVKQPEEIAQDSELLCYMGAYLNGSCLTSIDINNDGEEEIIYEPVGASWSHGLYILKEKMDGKGFFEPFCKNCSFSSTSPFVELKDINGDGLKEVIVPADNVTVDIEDGLKYEFKIYYYENGDFVLREKIDLPSNDEERKKRIEELSIKYAQ